MKIINDNSRRIGIFFFYDKDGIVDKYIPYLLTDLQKSLQKLIIVCNGSLNQEGRKKLEEFTKNIIIRENIGYDVFAYKAALEQIGYDNLGNYDELIMVNATIMGPIYPFSEMFEYMNQKNVDFWGITKYHENAIDPFNKIEYGYIPEHIQSHFMAIRKDLLIDNKFVDYWKNMKEINSYIEAICFHEAIFTKKFHDYGFKWEVYVDTDDLKDVTNYPLLIKPVELIKNKRCPIIKRRSFFHDYSDYLDNTAGEPAFLLLEYLKKNNLYDDSLIWENILRTENMYDIKNACQLNYTLADNVSSKSTVNNKVALLFHIYFEDLIEECYEYAQAMPDYSDIYITTNTEEKKNLILEKFININCNKFEVAVIENRGRDVSSLVVFGKKLIDQYDYICFAHDKKSKMLLPNSVGQSFSYKCLENILASKEFVENIIDTFNKEKHLGLLTPPPPNHAQYYLILGEEWTENYNLIKDYLKKYNFNVKVEEDKPPISPLGTMFWFRTSALKPIMEIDYQYEDFPQEPFNRDGTLLHVLERAYGLVVQESGFYPAYLMSNKFANIELTNLAFMIRNININLFKINDRRQRRETIEYIKNCCLYCEKHRIFDNNSGNLFKENSIIEAKGNYIKISLIKKIINKMKRVIKKLLKT